MHYRLNALTEGQNSVIPLELEDTLDRIEFSGDEIKLCSPVSLRGNIVRNEEGIFLRGTIECTVDLTCHRCLSHFEMSIASEIDAKLVTEDSPDIDWDQYFIIHDNMIDITNIIESTLIMTLPIKILCHENCKGLCSVCGVNLNTSSCHCTHDTVDPRLEKLKEFLQQD
ncbi:MAG: YceD family protein [Bacillota bacterium]